MVGGKSVVTDGVSATKEGTKTPPAKKRKDRPLGTSPVNPDLEDAMRGGGGRCVGCNDPPGVTGGSQSNHRAEKMDLGLPLLQFLKNK